MLLRKFRIIFFSLIYISLIVAGYIVFRAILLLTPQKFKQKIVFFAKILWLECTIAYGSAFFPHPVHIAIDKRIVENIRSLESKCTNIDQHQSTFISDKNIKIMSDDIREQNSLIISNHLTNYDWLFMLVVLHNLGLYKNVTIILKESLSRIPIFGSGMKLFGYLFVRRNWDHDRNLIKNALGCEIVSPEIEHFKDATLDQEEKEPPLREWVLDDKKKSGQKENELNQFKKCLNQNENGSDDEKSLNQINTTKGSTSDIADDTQIHKNNHTFRRDAYKDDNEKHILTKAKSVPQYSPNNKCVKSLLLFPEGTIHTKNEHDKTLKYVRKHNITYDFLKNGLYDKNKLFLPHHTLVPRLKGFTLVMDQLQPEHILDCTLFFMPFELYPQNKYDYKSVYFQKTGEIGFFAIIDYVKGAEVLSDQDKENNQRTVNQNNIESEQNTHRHLNHIGRTDNEQTRDETDYNDRMKNFLYNLFYKKNQNMSLYEQNNLLFTLDSSLADFKHKFEQVFVKNENEYVFMSITFIRKRNLLFLMLFCLLYMALKDVISLIYFGIRTCMV